MAAASVKPIPDGQAGATPYLTVLTHPRRLSL